MEVTFNLITKRDFIEMLKESSYGDHDLYINCQRIYCPSGISLKEYCGIDGGCKGCWLEAIKNVKFKGENLYLRVD